MRYLGAFATAVLLACTAAATAGAQAPAQQPTPETLQAAKDLAAVVSKATIADMASSMTASTWPQIEAATRRQIPKIDDATLGEMRAEYEKVLTTTAIESMNDAPPLYARYFTAGEMNEIAAFYRTPAGAKALTVMPKVLADFVPTLLVRLKSIEGQFTASLDNILKKHGYQAK
jgi:hypothetical protein